MRYTGFGIAHPLMVGKDKEVDSEFKAQMKEGLHVYLKRVIDIDNCEYLPPVFQKYIFNNMKTLLNVV